MFLNLDKPSLTGHMDNLTGKLSYGSHEHAMKLGRSNQIRCFFFFQKRYQRFINKLPLKNKK